MDQKCLQREWRSSWRTDRQDTNRNDENGWMDVSEQREERENPVEGDDQLEEEELHVKAQESEKADDGEGCSVSFPFMPANSDHVVFVRFTNNDKAIDQEDANKYDKNSNVENADTYDDKNNEEDSDSLPVRSTNGERLVVACKHTDKGVNKDYDKYNDDYEDDCFVAASISTDDTGGYEKDFTFSGLTFRGEEHMMTNASLELGVLNQELEEGEEEDKNENEGHCSFDDSDDFDMHPKKLYSDPAYPGMVFEALENMMLYSVLTDMTIYTEDGHQFQVHSIVLAAVSYLIQKMVRQKPRQERFITLCLGPEVYGSGFAAVVEFAYTGNISIQNKDNMELVWIAAVNLEAPRVLELCREMKQREQDKETGGHEDKKRISAEEHMNDSLQHIRQLWTQRVGCDVKFEAEGRVFHAHRVLLVASSDYFRGMFTSGMKESRQESVSLLLVRAAMFDSLLHYSYSGALALGWDCVFDLTCTSLQLQFQTAFSLCLNFLHQEIDAYSCLDVVSFAEAYGMADLLALANDFILRHFQDVSVSPKFQDLPVEKLKKYLQSDSLYVPSELSLFKAVMSWIEAFPIQRLKLAKELMGTIHFSLMTFKEFNEVESITSCLRFDASNLYRSLQKELYSSFSDAQSNVRVYLPKETLVLVGGETINDIFDKHEPCREMWFSNSFENHIGLVKRVEWRMLGTLPEKPRFSHGVGAIKGKLYVVGGRHYYGTDDTMKSTYMYDPMQNSWQRLADMHERRGNFTLVTLNGKLYAVGGERDSGVNMESVEVYCPNTNYWSFVYPLDQALSCHAASVWNDTIFLSGGFNSQYQCLSSMILYHPERGSTYLADMRNNRAMHCMETLGNHLYVAGGVSCIADGSMVDQLPCEVYDPVADSWTAIMPVPVPHVGSASVVLEGKVYIIGGYCHDNYKDTKAVHRYDPATERWENMSRTPGPNAFVAACVLPIPTHLRK
ncbi:kelch-like protein 33 [Pseudorasbora parva]|uniref:kelch-like protein 33 n=1 Tax=Pseudorasbora parva TaxID=51549 RepID=UPI00351F4128